MKIFVISPLRGDLEGNLNKLKEYCKEVFDAGHIPVCSHWYALVLDDDIPEHRRMGIEAGKELLKVCDEIWVFGTIATPGMEEEIEFARNNNKPIKWKF